MNNDTLGFLLDRPIAFHKSLAVISGSIKAGLFLSQAIYWSRKKPDGWFYKTQVDWEEETMLTRREQDSSRDALKKRGFISEQRKGIPAKMFFKVNFEAIATAADKANLDCTKAPKGSSPDSQCNSETTQRLQESSPSSLPPASGPSPGSVPPPSREPWMQAYCQPWEAKAGGKLPVQTYCRGFRQAEKVHGRQAVVAAWNAYLKETEAKFLSPHGFLAKIGVWLPSTSAWKQTKSDVQTDKGKYWTQKDADRLLGIK